MPERTYSRHSVFGMFSLVPDFFFQKANPTCLFPISLTPFLCQLPLQTQYTKIILGPSIEHCWPPHLPPNLDTCFTSPLQRNQYLHFFLLHTAISTILLPPRQSKSHYLPPWFINLPYTLLNPTSVSPDPFQTSYNFQGFPFPSETCKTGKTLQLERPWLCAPLTLSACVRADDFHYWCICCSHKAFSPRQASPTTGIV